ncbi:uncharacterized protein LOC124828500 [Vigna umbellata]|uniref:uncharacterized protein LOC124828500 n=1 Tax=Vigna umbellata TaxID=87088 RepID=UPI001F5EE7D3|nr:uncharacterized protein LOC124828500 [Vigna umbellata]
MPYLKHLKLKPYTSLPNQFSFFFSPSFCYSSLCHVPVPSIFLASRLVPSLSAFFAVLCMCLVGCSCAEAYGALKRPKEKKLTIRLEKVVDCFKWRFICAESQSNNPNHHTNNHISLRSQNQFFHFTFPKKHKEMNLNLGTFAIVTGKQNREEKREGKQSREKKKKACDLKNGKKGEFYLRYYVGHKGKFGHEFLEFEFRPDGKLRYANNSNYKNDIMIRKEVYLTPAVLRECRRIIAESKIMKEDDNIWPEPDRVGRQELEIVMGNNHISFATSKIGSLVDVQSSADPEGLRIFYFLVQDLKCFVFSLISLHFKIKPI